MGVHPCTFRAKNLRCHLLVRRGEQRMATTQTTPQASDRHPAGAPDSSYLPGCSCLLVPAPTGSSLLCILVLLCGLRILLLRCPQNPELCGRLATLLLQCPRHPQSVLTLQAQLWQLPWLVKQLQRCHPLPKCPAAQAGCLPLARSGCRPRRHSVRW